MKKLNYLYVLYGVWIAMFFVLTFFFSKNYNLFFLYAVIMFPTSQYVMKKRKEDINQMWGLVEELEMPIQTLSQISGIGVLDLKATKFKDNGHIFPVKNEFSKQLNS
ncbi:hypothetical protein P7H75_00915 [Vagococcus carniphilus]|uniref:hypothetical protein n=1 Tax=Vagococcus carniphilus TaxID=218144 RepID=UPI00288DA54E|nr:hypothetical protein [Vagococcus carniphilus]MDT2813389.1 hypothetical protein [Vagococcus carniphilus]